MGSVDYTISMAPRAGKLSDYLMPQNQETGKVNLEPLAEAYSDFSQLGAWPQIQRIEQKFPQGPGEF